MPATILRSSIRLDGAPLDVIRRWPLEEPLIVLHSGSAGSDRSRWNRYSIVTRPVTWFVHDGQSTLSGQALPAKVRLVHNPLADLDTVLAATGRPAGDTGLPFTGGWVGMIGYDLGRVIEPAAADEPPPDARGWPLIALGWCPDALVYDHVTGTWHRVGKGFPWPLDDAAPGASPPVTIGQWQSAHAPDTYVAMVSKTLELIAAGDIFQANMTQRFSALVTGSTRTLAERALAASGAWYGAYLELPDGRRIVSMSPELLLDVDAASRTVITRPIKGTRPHFADPAELARSTKDAAELHMIIDLMRNDLGRVCDIGTVSVTAGQLIETHGTVHHGVGEVRGRLGPSVSAGDLLRATFPGGSVTGAPKIRAMQIIDRLEPVARGPYCGAVGFLSDGGDIRLNVAIRTMAIVPDPSPEPSPEAPGAQFHGVIDYGVGAGIVADSDPIAELRESLDKAAVLRLV